MNPLGIPTGYQLQPDSNKLKKTITSNRELRAIYGINPVSKESQRKYHAFFLYLPIQESAIIGAESYRQGIFTYGQNHQAAANLGLAFWNNRVRARNGLGRYDYPKPVMTDPKDLSTAPKTYKIDDDDFDKFWQDAKKLPNEYAGDYDAPITFMVTSRVDLFSTIQHKLKN